MTRSQKLRGLAMLIAVIVPLVLVARTSGDTRVDASSALEIWNDVLRDVDALGTHLLSVSAAEEMRLGNRLAAGGLDDVDATESIYVQEVLAPIAEHTRRRGITYTARVINADSVNAWAVPGGHIFVTTGLLAFVRSEAELAAVLGHEVAHVDQRHCIDHFSYQIALSRTHLGGAGALVDMARQFPAISYSQYQEAEADAVGLRLLIEAGYDPHAAVDVMKRLAEMEGSSDSRPASGLAAEIGTITRDALGTYLSSHPDTGKRIDRLTQRLAAERRRVTGRSFYVGLENLQRRTSRARQHFAGEVKTFERG